MITITKRTVAMESVCILLVILGLILVISAALITRSAREVDEKICKDTSLSDEEFNKIRNEKVYRPEKLAKYLYWIGIVLQIPNAILAIKFVYSFIS